MLVLTRSINEAIIIGNSGAIKIIVLDIKGLRVRFGIVAPQQISINREEIFQKIVAKNDEMLISKHLIYTAQPETYLLKS